MRVLNLWLVGSDEPIGVTVNHPVFSADRQRWVEVGELKPGERLATATGEPVKVIAVTPRDWEWTVYNLDVHRDGTYYVSSLRVWAHNAPTGPFVVYEGDDGYIGHTGDYETRERYWRSKGRRIKPIREGIPDRDTALGVEQAEIERTGAVENGPNKRNAVNPNRHDDVANNRRKAGKEWLEKPKPGCPKKLR